MSNGLEALEGLKTPLHNEWLRFYPQFNKFDETTKIVDGCRMVKSDADNYLAVKQELERLEAIDNANTSEALKCLEILGNEEMSITESEPYHYKKLNFIYDEYFNTIKQTLLKEQEQAKFIKALEIIKKLKLINIFDLCELDNKTITQEEFELLKEVLEDD